MKSPENKAKLHELIKGTNLTESMIETAYANGAFQSEARELENGIQKGVKIGQLPAQVKII